MRARKRTPITISSLIVAAAALLTGVTTGAFRNQQPPPQGADTRDRYLNHRETDLSLAMKVDPADIPELQPVEPDRVLDTFRIKKGFRLELVAHEPQVVDPVQIAFDEHGRLYVVEMRWYQSEMRSDLMFDERIGRIRLLEDTNADGRFDRSTIFADKLRYPSAVLPYDGGVYVGVEPDVIYFKDRDGDGVADFRQVVFTGFGSHRDRLDSQMFLNSMTWGLDNRIHAAKGHGGIITSVAAPQDAPLDLRNRDFSFDPRTHRMRPESGGGKQGLTFDDYGRKFVCTQGNPFLMLMYEDRYAGRNPHYAPPRALADIGLEPGETADRQRVHRISPEDPWRRIRNRWRGEGIFAGPPPQPPGYITAATGVTLYRGDAFPAEYRQSVFVGASANNVVHRRTLVPDGVGFRARRNADEAQEEFLASTDVWFRPVAFANGPDGALYIADLYREIVDFSDGVPESIKRVKDLNRGNDRGRIYRVVPEGFRQPSAPRLDRFSTGELVSTLEHPNAWHRETASRLLYTRQDKSAVPSLARLAEQSRSALGRLHAVYSLDGLDALAETYILRALDDPDPGVREHGVRLSERIIAARGLSDDLWRRLKARVQDSAPRVRYQLAFTLGEIEHPERIDVLMELVRKDVQEPWVRVAVLSALADDAGDVFSRVVAARLERTPAGQAFVRELVRVVGNRNRGRELLAVLNYFEGLEDRALAVALLSPFADGLQHADVPLALFQPKLQPILDHALATIRDARSPEATRVQAIELVGLTAATADTSATLLSLVHPDEPRAVQAAAIVALARLNEPSLADEFLRRWSRFTPELKRDVLPLLLSRPERMVALMRAVDVGTVLRNELTPQQVAFVRAHRNPQVRRLAAAVFTQPARGDRPATVQRYLPALHLKGNVERGRITFQRRCASCHQANAEGYTIGPPAAAMTSSTREQILTHTLDPNRTVDARYRMSLIETRDGRSAMGIIHSETESSVTFRQPSGAATTLLRANIVRMQTLEQSLMPDGLEDGLSVQDMADLLEFILAGGS